ncbi:MAG: NAD(P)/FAD-dependent oxidoreductase [Flavobacteriales bacterium]|nr:NAD(P)/FAD-dependent oxidoreductase [Flavobacteriales bacterium]
MNVPETNLPRVVIIGGGFAGLNLAKKLSSKHFQTVLLDRNNYHTFQPLLYQVATAGLEPDSIAHALRKIFSRKRRFHFRLAEVQTIEPQSNIIKTNIGDLSYDHLVMATGSTTNFFGQETIKKKAMSMKSVPEALDIRSLILENFERALLSSDIEERAKLMNVVIVGGGPTGVELAGAIAELKKHVLPRDYPELDIRQMDIHLIEAAPRLLSSMSEKSSAASKRFLEKLDVQVWLDKRVEAYDGDKVTIADSPPVYTNTLIWAAGVKGCPIHGLDGELLTGNSRVKVDRFNRVANFTNIYAIGDLCQMSTEDYENGHPMVAQVAIQQGILLAKNLKAQALGEEIQEFEYKDLGSMATIGRNKAVVDIGKFNSTGWFAWFIWMVVHIVQLVGFRNKLVVLMNWMYNYWHLSKDIRLIIRPFRRE